MRNVDDRDAQTVGGQITMWTLHDQPGGPDILVIDAQDLGSGRSGDIQDDQAVRAEIGTLPDNRHILGKPWRTFLGYDLRRSWIRDIGNNQTTFVQTTFAG